MKDVFRQALELLGRPRGDARDLLDVGCAFGFFVEAAEQIGWRARGIDVCSDAVAAGQARGLPIDIGSVEEADFAPESFDAITLFYVLEHVREPRRTVERVFRWLKPGGRLMLRVPHSAPIVSMLSALGVSNTLLDPPHHLQDFSPRGLRSLLEGAGFQQVAMFPGASTRPSGVGSLMVTKVAGSLANALWRWTGGRLLVPGVSKTTTAQKQAD